jgi:hypothetical protein
MRNFKKKLFLILVCFAAVATIVSAGIGVYLGTRLPDIEEVLQTKFLKRNLVCLCAEERNPTFSWSVNIRK